MNKIFSLIVLLCFNLTIGFAQTTLPAYNKALADSLGADDYGMKKYVLVLLKTGTNTTTDKAFVDSMFRGHMQNIGRLVAAGKLVVAGPFQKNDSNYRGLFILNVNTLEEAQKALQTDPAVVTKLLDAELLQWYGSAALPLYLPHHDGVQKKKM